VGVRRDAETTVGKPAKEFRAMKINIVDAKMFVSFHKDSIYLTKLGIFTLEDFYENSIKSTNKKKGVCC